MESKTVTVKMQRKLLCLAIFCGFVAGDTDATFGRLCENPPNFGIGKITEENTCVLTYDITTTDETAAYNFCEMQHPFTLLSATNNGTKTVCKIRTYYQCKGSDVLIGNKCFIAKKASTFAEAAGICGREYRLNHITSSFEQKWITAFFTNHNMMWIANNKDQLKYLKWIVFEGQILSSKIGRLVKEEAPSKALAILTQKGAMAGMTSGIITPVKEEVLLSVLCSRDAELLDSYHMALMEQMKKAGVSFGVYDDVHGEKRNFLIVRSLNEFDMDGEEYRARTNLLHETCKGLTQGYAASPFDFKNVNDFKQFLKEEKVNIVAIPGNRDEKNKEKNMETCHSDPNFKPLRNQFYVDLPNGERRVVEDQFWRDRMPGRACADTPRTALGFSQEGVVDIPAIARLFVVCTYGKPYHSEISDEEKLCHHLAYYDKDANQCKCYTPENDMLKTTLFPLTVTEKSSREGEKCLDCSGGGSNDIVILIDISLNIDDLTHLEKLIRQFHFSFANHNSRITLCKFGATGLIYYTTKKVYKIDHDFIELAESEMAAAKKYSRGESYGLFSCGKRTFENHLQNALSNRKLMISVIGGPVTDSEEAANFFEEIQAKHQVRQKVFGVFNAEQEPNFKNFGDPEPFMIRGMDQQYPRDLYAATTLLEQLLTRNQCMPND